MPIETIRWQRDAMARLTAMYRMPVHFNATRPQGTERLSHHLKSRSFFLRMWQAGQYKWPVAAGALARERRQSPARSDLEKCFRCAIQEVPKIFRESNCMP